MYEVPEKEEKNNNFFDNMAFYDSVSVIAGRAVVTIDPLPEEKPIVQQPTRKLRWQEEELPMKKNSISKSVPTIYEVTDEDSPEEKSEDDHIKEKSKSEDKIDVRPKMATLSPESLDSVIELRRKSLRERRMSKSLYLQIGHPKEIPLIRQQSMPKFYLDTPDESQTASFFRSPSTALMSPIPSQPAFLYDLSSVVQMEKEREQTESPKDTDKSSKPLNTRLTQIKERIKLKRSKSSLGTITNLPHSHQHI